MAESDLRRPRIASRCRRCASSCAWLGSGSGPHPHPRPTSDPKPSAPPRVPRARAAHSPPEHSCKAPGCGSSQGEAGRVRVRDSGEGCTGGGGGAWIRLLRRASTKSCSTQMAARWSAGDLDVLSCGERNAAELCLPWKAKGGGGGGGLVRGGVGGGGGGPGSGFLCSETYRNEGCFSDVRGPFRTQNLQTSQKQKRSVRELFTLLGHFVKTF